MILFTIYSCIKLDDHSEELILNPKTAELHIGQKVRFGTNKDDVEWESKNKLLEQLVRMEHSMRNILGKQKLLPNMGMRNKKQRLL